MKHRFGKKTVWLSSILALAVFGLSQEKKEEPIIALVGATIIDGTGAAPVANATVLIQGQKITAVGPSAKVQVPSGAQKIDVAGKWILPGFIDCHSHTGYPFDDIQYFTDSDSLATLRSFHILDMYLGSGVTAVRDVGSSVESMQALLAAQGFGYIDSIRLFACASLPTAAASRTPPRRP